MPPKYGYIQSYTKFPKDLFRINNGPVVRLRAHPEPRRPPGLFDLLTYGGKVKPKALREDTYRAPNGASMRPNTPKMHILAGILKGSAVCIYSVPKGTPLPNELILVHEFRDHYSLQAREGMTVGDLNARITQFLQSKGECLSKDDWLWRYPEPTEVD